VVDIDPDVIYDLSCKGKYCVYGDAYDPLLLEKLSIDKAKMIITTFSGKKSNAYLIKKARLKNKKAKIITMADHADDAIYLYKIGADYVILPHHMMGVYVASMIEDISKGKKDIKAIKKSHIQFLREYEKR
jgi:Trk K+ transport system NAD-binding subunit